MADLYTAAALPAKGGSGDSPPDRYGRPPISLSENSPRIHPAQESDYGRSSSPISCKSPETDTAVAGAEEEEEEEEIKPNVFILDSGATVHATSDRGLLHGSRDLGPGDAPSLTRRDGEILWAILVGLVQLGTSFYLAEVHYFPGLPPASTLVSVHQLTRRGFSVMFCGADCFVRDRSTGAVVGKGQLQDEDGFYHLDYLRIPIT